VLYQLHTFRNFLTEGFKVNNVTPGAENIVLNL